MAILEKKEKIIADTIKGIYGMNANLGNTRAGKIILGYENILAGIYRTAKTKRGKKSIRNRFYMQYKERTENQKTASEKFKSCQILWKALTNEEKELYNKRAKKKGLTGNNLFIKECMLSE